MTSSETSDRPPRRATIDDVAARAGVSVATVSRALRDLPNVAESTRRRVTEVAAELSYRPDPAAARLAAGTTGTVTVAVPMLDSWYFSAVVSGAEAICAEAGLEFQVISIASPQQLDRLLDEANRVERRTDGLITIDVIIDAEQAASLERRRVALVTIGSRLAGHPSVALDDERVGRVAAEHLLDLGHQRIAVIGGVTGPLSFNAPLARRRGFEEMLAERDVAFSEELFVEGRFSVAGGYDAMSTLLALPERPTAVFAMSDEMAFGALMALDEHAVRPGVDLSIMGVDDHEFAQVVRLTTIRQSVVEHGSTAAAMLIEQMLRTSRGADRHDPETHPVGHVEPKVALIVRATTGPPR